MSILIKGMKMPKNCAECDISQAYDIRSTWCPLTFSTQAELKRQDNCPLIELPPHGRLIDADVLLEEVYKLRMWLLENNMPGAEHWVTKVYQMIDEMPTIIEAEGE